MKTQFKIWVMVITVIFLASSCKKDPGTNGNKEILGTVTYSGSKAIGATVYIAYNATEATGSFNDSTITDATGQFKFPNMAKGDYYIDASYVDQYGLNYGTSGYHVLIEKKKGSVTVDIALK